MEKEFYYKYSKYLKDKYGQKVYKIPVNFPSSCPVRDGEKSVGGCYFCGEQAAGFEAFSSDTPIKDQIVNNSKYIGANYGANMFEVFLQNFTNTYMPLAKFKDYIYEAVASVPNIAILSVSTRPDCIAKPYLDILSQLRSEYNIDIVVELGLQSVNANTLKILNRSHSLSEYIEAVLLIKQYGFNVCTHIISTLPWDSDEDVIEGARLLSVLNTDSVKLHSLYIEKNTRLNKMYENNEFELLTLEDYVRRTVDFLEYLKPTISVQRISARIPKENSAFANWGRSHWVLTDLVIDEFSFRGSRQGSRCNYGCDSAVRKFIGGDNIEL